MANVQNEGLGRSKITKRRHQGRGILGEGRLSTWVIAGGRGIVSIPRVPDCL